MCFAEPWPSFACSFGFLACFLRGFPLLFSRQVRPRKGTEICNFGAPSPLEALHWIFCFFSSFYVHFSKTSPLKSGESSEKSCGENRVKSCHVCGCHGFFGPDFFDRVSCLSKGFFEEARRGWANKREAFREPFDTEYDRAKGPPHDGSDPTSPLEVYKPLCFQTC